MTGPQAKKQTRENPRQAPLAQYESVTRSRITRTIQIDSDRRISPAEAKISPKPVKKRNSPGSRAGTRTGYGRFERFRSAMVDSAAN